MGYYKSKVITFTFFCKVIHTFKSLNNIFGLFIVFVINYWLLYLENSRDPCQEKYLTQVWHKFDPTILLYELQITSYMCDTL